MPDEEFGCQGTDIGLQIAVSSDLKLFCAVLELDNFQKITLDLDLVIRLRSALTVISEGYLG